MEWPANTSTCCWHCTYPFETAPVCVPNAYDDRRTVFYVAGTFCTWGCAYTFNLERDYSGRAITAMHLSELRRKILKTSSLCGIVPAPSRTTLKRFGGTLTIDEFRHGLQALVHDSVPADPAPIAVVPLAHRVQRPITKRAAPAVEQPYKLKRSKPMGNSGSTLFDSMMLRVERS